MWLDFANVDIKRLLDEGDDLRRLKAMAFVEIGQKRKVLIERDGQLKLGEPEPKAWFETYHPENERAIPVFTAVGGFTQPGFEANRVLVREVTRQVRSTGAKRAAEFGSGSGNLTFPLASLLENGVDAYESDELALRGLRQGAIAAGLSERIRIKSGDYQRLGSSRQPDFENVDLVLADPPRSGLMQFLDPLLEAPPFARPTHFVYVSCFAESFARDARRLCDSGYRLLETSIVDQFPQSPHYEVVVRFRRST